MRSEGRYTMQTLVQIKGGVRGVTTVTTVATVRVYMRPAAWRAALRGASFLASSLVIGRRVLFFHLPCDGFRVWDFGVQGFRV